MSDREALTAHQQMLLQAVYDTLRETGRWPSARRLRIQLHRADSTADLEEIARSAPELVSCDPVGNQNSECRMTLRALMHVQGAEEDRANVAAAIRATAAAYVEDEAERLTGADLAARAGLDEAALRRVAVFLRGERYVWHSLGMDATGLITDVTLAPELLHLTDVQALEDYLAFVDREAAKFRARQEAERTRFAAEFGVPVPATGTTPPEAPVSAEESDEREREREGARRHHDLRRALERLRAILIAVTTGEDTDTREYAELRAFVLEAPELVDAVPELVHNFARAAEARGVMKAERTGYAERRERIRREFEPTFAALAAHDLIPHEQTVSAAVHDVPAVRRAWGRALQRLPTDPEGAITAARTMLEATLRHVLDESGLAYSDKADLPDLTKPAVDALDLAPTKRSNIAVQRLLGACQTVVQNVGALRNELGDAHAKSEVLGSPRHAELAVNLAGAMAMFLLRTLRNAPDDPA